MDVPGLSMLLLLALAAAAADGARDFHLIDQLKTWSEAQSYCREHFIDLATIETEEEQARVTNMVVRSAHQDAWIGLHEDPDTWRWSLDDSLITDREPGTWFKFSISAYKSTHACAYLWYGVLREGRCDTAYASACYDEASNSIYPTSQWMSWADAQAYCRETYTDLPSVKSQQDLDQIMNSVDQQSYFRWVGLHRLTWRWSENGEPALTAWWPSEPDGSHQHCASAGVEGWNSTACTQLRPFICSGSPKRVIRVTLKTDGSVNLNDPLVQEAVLKKMEEDLRGHGVNQELSLSWRRRDDGRVFNQTEL